MTNNIFKEPHWESSNISITIGEETYKLLYYSTYGYYYIYPNKQGDSKLAAKLLTQLVKLAPTIKDDDQVFVFLNVKTNNIFQFYIHDNEYKFGEKIGKTTTYE